MSQKMTDRTAAGSFTLSGSGFTSAIRLGASRMLAVLLIGLLCFSFSVWHDRRPWLYEAMSFAGFVLVGFGMMGRIWCSSYISGCKNERLVTEGPYSVCRNPLYLFSCLAGLGVLLTAGSLLIVAVYLGLFWAYYPAVVSREEGVLTTLHGPAYAAYQAKVPRFWPDFSLLSEPETQTVRALRFRRFLAEVFWFVPAVGLIRVLEELHEHGQLPTLFQLY